MNGQSIIVPGISYQNTPTSAFGSITDTNGNNLFDKGEPYIDTGNGVWNDAEIFYDHYSNGVYDSGDEPFEDRNCNGSWDDAELRVSEEVECEGIGVFITDDAGGFCDKGNGIWDNDPSGNRL